MKIYALTLLIIAFSIVTNAQIKPITNPAIDMDGFLKAASEAAKHRSTRRLTEDEFIKISRETGVVILDARSRDKFDELHINGAVSLPFPDITVDSLARLLPDKKTRILIYCNNNFTGAEQPFPTKMPAASLNLSTYVSLYSYGYRNIYELGPLVDVETTKLDLVPTEKAK